MIKKKANAKHMKNGNHAAPKTGKAAGSTRPLNVNQTYNAKKGKAQSSKHSKPQAGQTKQMKPTPQYDLNDQELIKKAYATIGQHAPKKTKQVNKKKVAAIAGGSCGVLLVIVYLAGALFFSNHFFPNTFLGTQDLSLQSSDEFAEDIRQKAFNYKLNITGLDFEFNLDANQAGIVVDQNKIAQDASASQNNWAWPIEIFMTHDISDLVSATYDQEELNNLLGAAVDAYNTDRLPTQNATITWNDEENTFEVKKEVYGDQIDKERLVQRINEGIRSMISDYELTEEDLVQPTIFSDDERFPATIEAANKIAAAEVTLTMSGVDAGTIDSKTIASWVKLDKDLQPSLNNDAVVNWAGPKGEEFNTVGTTRTWTRADGKKCSVGGGTYGWQVNTETLAQSVIDGINTGAPSTVDIPCSQSADVYNGAGKRDWGAYVDVDISQQTVRYYDANDNLLHSAPCVTGSTIAGHDTPTGIYYLNSKQSPTVLTGYKDNGEIDYESHVSYWMPFIGNSIGLHDATWQSAFGGTRYKDGYGSHGCVNLSLSDAQWFYQNISIGVCVITHY